MSPPDPLGRAMLDYERGEYGRGDLQYVDGERTQRGYVREHYFGDPFEPRERDAFVEGPVLDAGCGAGRDALRFGEEFRTLAVDASPNAVRAARERGVGSAAVADMFDLALPDGALRTVHSIGTQAGLAGSLTGLAGLLAEFARVTGPEGRAVVDAHDPTAPGAADLFGYRPDPRPRISRRTFHFEYGDEVGRTLAFLLLSPARFREVVAATGWDVAAVSHDGDPHYVVLLEKGAVRAGTAMR